MPQKWPGRQCSEPPMGSLESLRRLAAAPGAAEAEARRQAPAEEPLRRSALGLPPPYYIILPHFKFSFSSAHRTIGRDTYIFFRLVYEIVNN